MSTLKDLLSSNIQNIMSLQSKFHLQLLKHHRHQTNNLILL